MTQHFRSPPFLPENAPQLCLHPSLISAEFCFSWCVLFHFFLHFLFFFPTSSCGRLTLSCCPSLSRMLLSRDMSPNWCSPCSLSFQIYDLRFMGVVLFTLLGFELFWCLLVAASDLLGEFAFRIRLAPLSFFSGKGRRRRFLSRVPYLFNICRPVTFSPPSTRASFVQRCLFSLFSFLIYNFVFSESLLLLCFSKELRTFVPPCCRLAFEFILSSCCCVETRIQRLEVASQGKCA